MSTYEENMKYRDEMVDSEVNKMMWFLDTRLDFLHDLMDVLPWTAEDKQKMFDDIRINVLKGVVVQFAGNLILKNNWGWSEEVILERLIEDIKYAVEQGIPED